MTTMVGLAVVLLVFATRATHEYELHPHKEFDKIQKEFDVRLDFGIVLDYFVVVEEFHPLLESIACYLV